MTLSTTIPESLSTSTEHTGSDEPATARTWPLMLVAAAVVLTVGTMYLGSPDRETVGMLTMLLLVELLLLGIHIGMAMILSAVLCIERVSTFDIAEASLRSDLFNSVSSWQLSVVPMFVLMGVALWTSGLTGKAYSAASIWFGKLPGGLGIATMLAGAGLSASSGSTMGITVGLTKMSVPEMLKAGYSAPLATGSVAMAGTLGQLIPPSILMVIYAGIAHTPVGPQLIAGLLPGILFAVFYSLLILGWAMLRPQDAPHNPSIDRSFRARLSSVVGILPLVFVVLAVVGGMFTGIFTATEAAGIGAAIAMIVGWLSQPKGRRGVRGGLAYVGMTTRQTVISLSGVFVLLIGATMLTTAIARSGLAQVISNWLAEANLSRVELLLILVVFYVLLGMFLESLPMILLTVPFLQPPLEAAGVDMIWFGVFIIIMCEIGMVFPPIGMLVFVVHRLVQDKATSVGQAISLSAVFKGIFPFVGVAIALVVVYIAFPEILLWLPEAQMRE